MNLGWLDVCLRVKSVSNSREFYECLGFRQVEGSDSEGWAVVVNGDARLGLFEAKFMESEFSLNFRGGDVLAITDSLRNRGYAFTSGPTAGKSGGASATLNDPDGHMIFLDSAPGETKRT